MGDQVRINGNEPSWSSVYFKLDGSRYYGFKAVNYSDSRERVMGYGMGRDHAPRARSAGKYGVDPASVTVDKPCAIAMRDALKAKAIDGRSIGDVEFEIVVQYVEGDVSATDELVACVLVKIMNKAEEGPDGLTEEWEIQPMRIIRDGTTLYNSSESTP